MKRTIITLALIAAFMAGGEAHARIGTIDQVPAATLLLPYFEVDLDNPTGLTILFSTGNASAAPAIAHISLYTDWAVFTLDFNVYLTGYDVVSFDLRDLFTTGATPDTDSVGGAASPAGPLSLPPKPTPFDASSCDGQLPLPEPPQVLLQHIRDSHTGRYSSVLYGYAGEDHGDNVARGYITIDNVNTCTFFSPHDGDIYFGDPVC